MKPKTFCSPRICPALERSKRCRSHECSLRLRASNITLRERDRDERQEIRYFPPSNTRFTLFPFLTVRRRIEKSSNKEPLHEDDKNEQVPLEAHGGVYCCVLLDSYIFFLLFRSGIWGKTTRKDSRPLKPRQETLRRELCPMSWSERGRKRLEGSGAQEETKKLHSSF